MKKIFLLLIFLNSVLSVYSQAFSFIENEEYAFYMDQRDPSEKYIRGFWALQADDSQTAFYVRNISVESGEEITFLVVYKRNKDNEIEVTQLKGLTKDTPSVIVQSYIDIMNFCIMYEGHISEISGAPDDLQFEDPWENYSLYYDFNYYLPLFRFRKITLEKKESNSYTLLCGGKIKYQDSQLFFDMDPLISPDIKKQKSTVLEDLPLEQKTIDRYQISLDNRWVEYRDEYLEGYWLKVNTIRDSQISIERFQEDKFIPAPFNSVQEFVRKTLYVDSIEYFDISSLSVTNKEGVLEIQYESVFEDKENFSYRKLFKDGDDIVIINFSTLSQIYEDNLQYYQNLLDSIK